MARSQRHLTKLRSSMSISMSSNGPFLVNEFLHSSGHLIGLFEGWGRSLLLVCLSHLHLFLKLGRCRSAKKHFAKLVKAHVTFLLDTLIFNATLFLAEIIMTLFLGWIRVLKISHEAFSVTEGLTSSPPFYVEYLHNLDLREIINEPLAYNIKWSVCLIGTVINGTSVWCLQSRLCALTLHSCYSK